MTLIDYLFGALVLGLVVILLMAGLASDPIESLLMLAGTAALGVLVFTAKPRKT